MIKKKLKEWNDKIKMLIIKYLNCMININLKPITWKSKTLFYFIFFF